MKYSKNQYSDGASFCALVIALGFIYWGIVWWMLIIWPMIMISIGLSIIYSQLRAIANRGRLRKAVKFEYETNPEATVESVSRTLGITKKDVQAINLDLKMRGELKGNFSTTTGQIEVIQDNAPEEVKAKFCPHCGTPIREGSPLFCAYCGAPLQEKAIAN